MTEREQSFLHLKAPAKVNLQLRVVRRREDGYHELETWMQKLDLCDDIRLTLTERPGITLECDWPEVPTDESNLAWRAAAAYLAASKRLRGRGVDIALAKRIPAGAGLGGGSSDGGTVLRGLNRMAGGEFGEEELIDLARPLGADVPFFVVEYGAVSATGIGDLMRPVKSVENCTFVLLNPGFHVSTRWVYETFALTRGSEDSILASFLDRNGTALSLANMHNDLEPVTSRKYPEIEEMKERLLAVGASGAMMSGSGPTVFGVFPDEKSEKIDFSGVAERLGRKYRYRVFVVRAWVGAWPSGEGTGF